jgi:hypothetical protein
MDVTTMVYASLTRERMKTHVHRTVVVEEVSPVIIMAFVPQMKRTIIVPQTVQIPGLYGRLHIVQIYKYTMHMV